MIDQEKLDAYAAGLGIPLTPAQLAQFDLYAQLLVEWNEKMNLTAITDPQEIVVKHFVDSLTLLTAVTPPQNATLADVGTGAGFPSVPVHIVRPDLRLTLIDSLQKRLTFLAALSQALGQQNTCVHARAEDAGRTAPHREAYDLVTARAVANLRELAEYCLPLVKVGGQFVALKGGELAEELAGAQKAIATLGGRVVKNLPLQLPGGDRRTLLVIAKTTHTPASFPRPRAKMLKNPLA